jgi:hypothetical protein
MVINFIDKLSGFFDRRFIIAHWAPVFITFGLAGGISFTYLGLDEGLKLWTDMNAVGQALLGIATMLSITVLAFISQALVGSIIRFYEGYWPAWLLPIKKWACADQKKILDSLGSDRFYIYFPKNPNLLRATRLGNILTAAEEYPYLIYQMETIDWWPRLVPLLPDPFRIQVDFALTPIVALLNLSTCLILLTLGSSISILLADQRWWLFVLIVIIGLLLARLCYLAATDCAVAYGNLIRVAFDLHRHKILKQMDIPVPDNLAGEIRLWSSLNHWISEYIPPPDSDSSLGPFYYTTHHEPSSPTSEQIDIGIKGLPTLTIRRTR